MQQYLDLKASQPGKILLFQMGDFFETFFEDAETVSRVLGIALTSRELDRETGEPVPLAGFPVHALDGYLSRLLRAGYRVAVCEQTEEPAKARRLVRREVTEVVTPGTVVSGQALGDGETALLASICNRNDRSGIAFCDLSCGEIEAVELPRTQAEAELSRRSPRELLVPEDMQDVPEGQHSVTPLESWKFDEGVLEPVARRRLGVATTAGLGIQGSPALAGALAALLGYVEDVKRTLASNLRFKGVYRLEDHMLIDRQSAIALDLVESPFSDRESTLAWATDRTVTPQGGRLWRRWLLAPPADPRETAARHGAVGELASRDDLESLRRALSGCCDMGRHAGRLSTLKSGPRDLRTISATAARMPGIASALKGSVSPILAGLAGMDTLGDIAAEIDRLIEADPPIRPGEGNTIARGVSAELDEYRAIRSGGREMLAAMEAQERKATGIPRLTIGYNRVFGYYIEVPRNMSERVPGSYRRRQTLAGSERYSTPELEELELKMQRADQEIARLECSLFDGLTERLARKADRLRAAGESLAILDCLCGLASLAAEKGWCRPSIEEGPVLCIEGGRHPVLDATLPPGECVPNPVRLDQDRTILIVTGPNMAGKSTYLRMAAQLLVLAQAGSFVPAESMRFSPADRLFTRIGSSDRISRGQSTFLLEMADAAAMLNSGTPRSVAVIDEIGRGTSTYDGLAIAWAMLEHIHSHPVHRPLTLFATHYHELTVLGSRLERAANLNVTVRESAGRVVFLYRVEEGAADRSYGIHVAMMAGVPPEVVARASRVLADLEKGSPARLAQPSPQLDLPLARPEQPVLDAIRMLDPDALTARQALELVYELRRMLSEA